MLYFGETILSQIFGFTFEVFTGVNQEFETKNIR